MGRWRRAAAALLAGWMAVQAGGCNMPPLPHLFVWAFADRHPKKTINAEYALEADLLVVVPYVGTEILFHDPTLPLEVSRDVAAGLAQTPGGRVKQFVHPVQVVRWQESNIEWPNMALEDIAKTFKADTILYVEIERYTLIEEGSANLYRGRVRARLQVVKVGAERNPVFETVVETIYPEDQPVGVMGTSERVVRGYTNMVFARDVVRKFCDYQVEDKGGQP